MDYNSHPHEYDPGDLYLDVSSPDSECSVSDHVSLTDLRDPVNDGGYIPYQMVIPKIPYGLRNVDSYYRLFKESAFKQGYAISVLRSKYTSTCSYIKFACVHSAANVHSTATLCQHSSYDNNCSFILILRQRKLSFYPEWYIDLETSVLKHNHHPSHNMSIYPQYRRSTFIVELRNLALC
ncbi:hypothetical protein P9112_007595 [Eukaryota sp. TZLM1-RC]